MDIEELPTRLTDTVEGLRDRTAGAIAPDTSGSASRAIAKLRSDLDDTEDRLADRITASTRAVSARIDELADIGKKTTLPRKLFWFALGAAVGTAAAYLGDPDRGTSRRAQLSDQAAARARDVAEQAKAQAKMAGDKARGQVAEAIGDALPDTIENDPALLEQRVKSEVFGHRDDVQAVVLRIDGPGVVALKGTIPGATNERELIEQVADVDGVIDVRSELVVRT